MSFRSILFMRQEDCPVPVPDVPPPYFHDLNLDQVVDCITQSHEAYDLKPLFYVSLSHADAVNYRHEVFRDLEHPATRDACKHFAERMRKVDAQLAKASRPRDCQYHRAAWFLDAVDVYCLAVLELVDALGCSPLSSRGLLGFRDHVERYARGGPFTSLLAETRALKGALAEVKYCLLIKTGSITVRKYASEPDYTSQVTASFARFKEGPDKVYKSVASSDELMTPVEAGVLGLVAKLYPDTFAALDRYCARHSAFLDDAIGRFNREIHFYIAYRAHIDTFKRPGLPFCYPRIRHQGQSLRCIGTFDLALANTLARQDQAPVCNDFQLDDDERIIVVTGPNQGGKTTFARAFGQLHHLASIGCPVPGREATLCLFDNLFTHFEREERVASLRGKLEDDLVRIHRIWATATPRSIVILNEIFTSTTLGDAIFLSTRIMEKLVERGVSGVWVTFIDELSSFGDQTVSMVSSVVPDNPAIRTYKVVRRRADGLAYAVAIAEKYGLSYDALKERLEP